ncbi:MAG: hypothetical protein WCA32_13620, partial [Chromatiaceae bacterium]
MIPAATSQESRKRWLARMQAVRSRLQGRPDSEHEQALIRLGVGLVASAYLLWRGADSDNFVWAAIIPAVVYVFMAAATLILVDIVIRPEPSPLRRCYGISLDLSATTALMALSGEGGIPLFAVYLWVTLGNGFRYGQRYLAASAILSLAGFTTVFLVSDFWRGHAEISVGLLIV